MSFTLRNEGYPFKKIYQGRKWVGRVARHADGGYLGIIGKITVREATEVDAFEQVVSQALGFANPTALKMHNSAIRQANKASRTAAAFAVDQALNRGNWKPFFDCLDNMK